MFQTVYTNNGLQTDDMLERTIVNHLFKCLGLNEQADGLLLGIG